MLKLQKIYFNKDFSVSLLFLQCVIAVFPSQMTRVIPENVLFTFFICIFIFIESKMLILDLFHSLITLLIKY